MVALDVPFYAEGFRFPLSEEDIDGLVAFLLTQ